MVKVKQVDKVNTSITKTANSKPNSIKKKGTLKNNLKDSRRKGLRAKALLKKVSVITLPYLIVKLYPHQNITVGGLQHSSKCFLALGEY